MTPAQMERWCRDFDNWAVCDTVCFYLFDRTPHAWLKVDAWSSRCGEFEVRAAVALLASLAGHDQTAGDEPFLQRLPLLAQAATDERNFVKKGASWALRRIGWRNAALNAAIGRAFQAVRAAGAVSRARLGPDRGMSCESAVLHGVCR